MKECKIIGYGKFNDKETKEEMLRVVVGIPSTKENYKGIMVTTTFLKSNDKLIDLIERAIKEDKYVNYESSDNVVSGKTKITNFVEKEEF